MDSKRIKFLKLCRNIFFILTPICLIAFIVFDIIYQNVLDYENITPLMVTMGVLAYSFLIISIILLFIGCWFASRAHSVANKKYMKKYINKNQSK